MGFETLLLKDVKIEKPAPVPVGAYIFQLQPGASTRENPYNQIQELNLRFDVTEGEFAGRPVFVSYPDPQAISKKNGKPMTWSAQALKKLEVALGTDALDGEDSVTYFNRVALNHHSRVSASILPGKSYKDKTTGEQKDGDPEFGIFTVGAAA